MTGRFRKRLALVAALLCTAQLGSAQEVAITHGPTLGRPGPAHMGVWLRTSRPAGFRVRYGTQSDQLDLVSAPGSTRLERDNTGWVMIDGLAPATEYFYQCVLDGSNPSPQAHGRFRTLPDRNIFHDENSNPDGRFNFAFEFGCGNLQRRDTTTMAVFETLRDHHLGELDFAIANGDWIYEEDRDYTLEAWRLQTGIAEDELPRIVRLAPAIAGVWQNYKTYLARCASVAAWHRNMPSYFLYDDHEIVDDSAGAGTIGARPRRGLFRDIAVQAWFDYAGWSNDVETTQDIHFGEAALRSGDTALVDEAADFTKLRLDEAGELHVHWGGPTAGLRGKEYDAEGGDPNAGVYEIVRVLDARRLEIRPAPPHDGRAAYSIGRRSYWNTSIANCDFVFLDTRGHRDLPVPGEPHAEGISLLGRAQKEWLKSTMTSSSAQCFFVVSTVNFMIPHVADVGTPTAVEDSWTGFIRERDEMIDFFAGLEQKVFLLTGDLHNSFVVKISENVWEFASGPHNSGNATAASEGNRPANGSFDSYGRPCFIRWSTWFGSRTASRTHPRKIYCIAAVNNVFPDASEENARRVRAFPIPQVTFRYHDGETGALLYAESVLLD